MNIRDGNRGDSSGLNENKSEKKIYLIIIWDHENSFEAALYSLGFYVLFFMI